MLKQDSIWCEQCQRNTLHNIGTLCNGIWWVVCLLSVGAAVPAFLIHHLVIEPFLKWKCQSCGYDG